MQVLLLKIGTWLTQKLLGAALIVLVALAAYGAWLYLQEERILEQNRIERLQAALAERDRLVQAREAIEQRFNGFRAELAKQEERLRQAEKIVASLRSLESWWERWFGNSRQQSANLEQAQRVEALKREAAGQVGELQRALARITWERDGAGLALRRVTQEIGRLEESRSRLRHYVLQAWEKLRWYVLTALLAYFFGPTLWAAVLYFGFAPQLARSRPIQLGPDPVALPDVGESRVSVEAVLRPGDVMRLKEQFLQASDEGVGKHTRFVLDWEIPFTSLACGLVELIELRHTRPEGEYRVTLSSSDDPHREISVIALPTGSSLVVRPSFLAGVIQGPGERIKIRRHWRIFRWQSWVSGQFRFFEFVGPGRLIVTGSRGVRVERLADRVGQEAPARRTNQDATIGFTPNLAYRPVRAETFWSYYRGQNPLFDDLFAGRGLFISQETATPGPAAKAGAFWSGVWNGVLKVFGL